MAKSIVNKGQRRNAEVLWHTRALREGRGTGYGKSYIPWIQVRRFDFSSYGRSHLVPNPFTGRLHHVLSDLEMHTLMLLLWAPHKDIREQFPLQPYTAEPSFCINGSRPLCSVEIAKKLGVKHPEIKKGLHRYMTTDFLVTHPDGTHSALYVKYSEELDGARSKSRQGARKEELIEIAREYWLQRAITFRLVSEIDINQDALRWCFWLFDALDEFETRETRFQFVDCLLATDPYDCLSERIAKCAATSRFDKVKCGRLLKQSIFLREVSIDITQNSDLTNPWVIEKALPSHRYPEWHFLNAG